MKREYTCDKCGCHNESRRWMKAHEDECLAGQKILMLQVSGVLGTVGSFNVASGVNCSVSWGAKGNVSPWGESIIQKSDLMRPMSMRQIIRQPSGSDVVKETHSVLFLEEGELEEAKRILSEYVKKLEEQSLNNKLSVIARAAGDKKGKSKWWN